MANELVGRAFWELSASDDQLERDLKAGEQRVRGSGDRAAKEYEGAWAKGTGRVKGHISSLQGALAAVGIGIGLATVLTVFGGAVNAASDLNEEVTKSRVVFGAAAASVEQFGESAAAIGFSKREALGAAGAFGNMLNTVGLTQAASAEMSTTMVQLAADMASFNNEDPSDMLQRLRSGLAGEAEPLRQFGVLLSEAEVKAFAYANGIARAGDALTEAQKVQARYGLILKQTAIQQGDVERSGRTLPALQRQLAADMENVAAKLGQKLLPLLIELASFAKDVLVPALGAVIDNLDKLAPVIAGVVNAFMPLAPTMARIQEEADASAVALTTSVDQARIDAARYVGYLESMASAAEDTTGATASAWDAMLDTLGPQARRKIEDAILVVREVPGGIAATLRDGQTIVGTDAADLAAKITDAFRTAKEDSLAEAAGLIQGLVDLFTEEEFVKRMEEQLAANAAAWSDWGRAVTTIAYLSSAAITEGLTSQDAQRRAATIAEVNEILGQYQLLPPGVRAAAEAANPELVAGLQSNFELVSTELRNQVGMQNAELREMIPVWRAAGLDAVANHAEGILKNRALATYAAGQTRRETLAEFEDRNDWAFRSGSTISRRFAEGLMANYDLIADNSITLADAAASGLRHRSPAKAGPFMEDPAIWSEFWIGRWRMPWLRAVPLLSQDSVALANAAAGPLTGVGPGGGFGGFGGASTAGGVGGGTTHIERHIHLHAEQGYPILEQPADVVRQLGRAQWFDREAFDG